LALGRALKREAALNILTVNVGSSSQKLAFYAMDEGATHRMVPPVWEAYADWMEQKGSVAIHVKAAGGATYDRVVATTGRTDILTMLLNLLWSGPTQVIADSSEVAWIGHRVVHGGLHYTASVPITTAVKESIKSLAQIAPLHNLHNLEGITLTEDLLPGVPQLAVFDTAFHTSMPPSSQVLPVPYAWYEQGIRRFGFHGISHQYIAEHVPSLLKRHPVTVRIISCHLGGGCSVTAIRGGKSVDTTMGFTPLDGVMMETRSGTLDPGLMIYLLRQGISIDELESTLDSASGLLGISNISGDVRILQTAALNGDKHAQLALDVFTNHIRKAIGAMWVTLGGADAIAFTGGMGEHSSAIRSLICTGLDSIGAHLDLGRNAQAQGEADVAESDSPVRIFVIPTGEDWMIARECYYAVI
jgi:acetate kinase